MTESHLEKYAAGDKMMAAYERYPVHFPGHPPRNPARQLAHRFLPTPIRKTLGTAAGRFHHTVIRWFQGAIFDLSGGHFRADGCTFAIPKDQTSRAYRSC